MGTDAPATRRPHVLLTYAGQMLAIVRYAPEREREVRGDFELLRVFLPQHETE